MRLLFYFLLLLNTFTATAQVHQYTLDNGLKILVKEDHRAPVAVSMIWYKVGSSDEPGGITGVSHTLEHIMFKGTPKYPQGAFSQTIAVNGGQENAFTNYDYTAYFVKMAASKLPVSLKLEADRMKNLLLDPKEFAKEIKVVQEERRLRTDDNPQALTFERFLATAHLAVPYQHPVIGWMNDLKNMNINDVKAWYQTYYVPNNATLVIVGDVQPENIHQLAKKYFGPIKKSPLKKRKNQLEPPVLGKKTVQVKAPAKLPMVMLGYPVHSVKTANNAYEPYALELIGGILDAGESSRFAQDLIRDKQIATDVEVYYNLYTRYQPQFIIYGIPAQRYSMSDLKKQILHQLKRLKNKPVSQKELDRVKKQIIAEKTFEKDSIFGQAMELGLLETVGIGWPESEHYTDKIKKITAEQIQKTAQRYFNDNALTQANLLPQNNSKRNS